MREEHTSEPESDESPGSVFGNLPGSRPGTRSPRRASGKGAKPASAKAKAKPKPAARPRPKPATPRREREPLAAEPEAGGTPLEDIAWAGIAAAAEAATLGVRLASRAMESLRGNPDERG